MLNRKALNQRISGFVADLKTAGYSPSRVVLFGSYAKGKPNDLSVLTLPGGIKNLLAVARQTSSPLHPSFQNTHC